MHVQFQRAPKRLPTPCVITLGALLGGSLSMAVGGEGSASTDSALRPANPLTVHALMPCVPDYTLMWWAEGFPGHTPSAPWWRVIQTGGYVFVFDTATLRVPHFGRIQSPHEYAAAAREGRGLWREFPAAELALTLTADGRTYRATAGGPWTEFTGPRLVESGRFLQRADVTDLVFTAADGTSLNVEARFETVAWPSRLALILAARPGLRPIPPGEKSFGRVGGGFGLTGTNHFEVLHRPELDPEHFTLELWVYVTPDSEKATRAVPWLVCKNSHEEADGNYGITLLNGHAQARLNIGGGRDNRFSITAPPHLTLRTEAWNHLAFSYDSHTLRLYVNGEPAGDRVIDRPRVPGRVGLAFGRRQDNDGDGYHFRGAVDEIRLYPRALTPAEVRERFQQPETDAASVQAVAEWCFEPQGQALASRPGQAWTNAAMAVSLHTTEGTWERRWELPPGQTWHWPDWRELALGLDSLAARFQFAQPSSPLRVQANERPADRSLPVHYDDARGWHRVSLDGIEPTVPAGDEPARHNDAIERVRLLLANPTDHEQTARLLFAKNGSGIRQRLGSPITGMSAILRHPDGQPTGIPVQLSKNWHTRPAGGVYAGTWFHGFSQVRLPPHAQVELELALVYGHWGGVAAASHAQLCLIGWGSNQLWDQSALGAWGESICFEPDQVQAAAGILDVRPLMVRSMAGDQPWQWTHNVGGGDVFRLFDLAGIRVLPAAMRTAYERQGPCLTDVTYAGRLGDGLEHAVTVSLARTDDLVRGTYHVRLDVRQPTDFSRFVIFQVGADTYSYTGERKLAVGDETGLIREWPTEWGGGHYRTAPHECTGRVPWLSLHEAVSRAGQEARARGQSGAPGAWANRGIVIRSWQARLGGRPARPWVREYGVNARGADTSTLDILPPPDVVRLVPGDYVEAIFEHLVMPQFAADYYGPNQALRAALESHADTWRLIHREAVGNDRRIDMASGKLLARYPAVKVQTVSDTAAFTLTGGLGYVPITFTGLSSPLDLALLCEDLPVDQSVHGQDFWQTDFDPVTRSWSRTYNLPVNDEQPRHLRLVRLSDRSLSSL